MNETPNGSSSTRLNLTERLDVALAGTLSTTLEGPTDGLGLAERQIQVLAFTVAERNRWISGILGLRGYLVTVSDVEAILAGREGRYGAKNQEFLFVKSLDGILDELIKRGAAGIEPNGGYLVELFRRLTAGVPKYQNNHIRRDLPWDASANVNYPLAADLPDLLESFGVENRYRDIAAIFDNLHPVRQSFRVLWRFSRISPFPDLNLPMAFIAMNAFQVARGYPMTVPQSSDRSMLTRLVTGPPPKRIVQFELRMVERLEELV